MRSKVVSTQSLFGDDFDVSGSVDVDSLIETGASYGSSVPGIKAIAGSVASGAAIGATFGALISGPMAPLGATIGAIVGSVAGFVESILPSIANALNGQCTITIAGLDTDCKDYPRNVKGAAEWMQENLQACLSMNPDQFADQTHVLPQDFITWFNTPPVSDWADFHERVLDTGTYDTVLKKLPGTQTLLRSVQIPAAAALAAATPELIALYKVTFPQTFPALTPDDIAKIAMRTQPLLEQKVNDVAAWIRAQPIYPTPDQVHGAFPMLVPNDINRAIGMAPQSQAQRGESILQLSTSGPHLALKPLVKVDLKNITQTLSVIKDAQTAALRKNEKWWQKLLEKVHLRKPPVAT